MLGFCLLSGVVVGWCVFGWLFVVVLMFVGAVVVWVFPVFILCLLWMVWVVGCMFDVVLVLDMWGVLLLFFYVVGGWLCCDLLLLLVEMVGCGILVGILFCLCLVLRLDEYGPWLVLHL